MWGNSRLRNTESKPLEHRLRISTGGHIEKIWCRNIQHFGLQPPVVHQVGLLRRWQRTDPKRKGEVSWFLQTEHGALPHQEQDKKTVQPRVLPRHRLQSRPSVEGVSWRWQFIHTTHHCVIVLNQSSRRITQNRNQWLKELQDTNQYPLGRIRSQQI